MDAKDRRRNLTNKSPFRGKGEQPLQGERGLIAGRQPLIEAIMSGRSIDKILFQRNISGESIGEIRKLAKEKNIPIQQVPPEKLYSLSRANHQGVIAFASMVQYMDLQQTVDHI